jgi:hypothetical protein
MVEDIGGGVMGASIGVGVYSTEGKRELRHRESKRRVKREVVCVSIPLQPYVFPRVIHAQTGRNTLEQNKA